MDVIPEPILKWDTPKNTWHSVRVMCDDAGLTVAAKNVLCACLYQESQFYNYEADGDPVRFKNKDKSGETWSSDWGLCQINDYFHIGPGKDFPTVDYVMQNPDKVFAWMIKMYKNGQLGQWSSYKFGAYKKWLAPGSAMWLLAK